MTPALSVCICTYNRPEWLHECVLSVLRSVGVDMEILIVDNGSTPETAEVLDLLGDPRIHVERLEHNDQAKAHRILRGLARGRYTLILPDDDVIVDPLWLGHAVERLDQTGARICSQWNPTGSNATSAGIHIGPPPERAGIRLRQAI